MPVNVVLENNAGDIRRSEPFRLPISPEILREHLNSLQFEPTIIDNISVQASLVEDGGFQLVTHTDNPETVLQMDELNYLATLYDALEDAGKIKFKAVLEYIGHGFSQFPHELGNIGDTIDIILNLDKFTFYPGIDNLQELGVRVFNDLVANETEDMDEFRAPNPPYKAHAEANIRNYGGCFTSGGYVAGRGEGFVPHFMLNGVPEEYRVWEKAFAELPPFENPIKIDYEELSNGHTGLAAPLLGHEVLDFLSFESNIPTYSEIAADDHIARGRQIIELATLVQAQDEGLIALIEKVAEDSSLTQFPYELIDRINDPKEELDIQLHLERSYGIDDEYEENYRDELMKLPPDLQFDEYIKAMMENRKRHQKMAESLEKQEPPLSQLTQEEQKRFDMLPADKQARLVAEQDIFMQYCALKLENARAMAGLYTERIEKYQLDHAKEGPYDPEKIQRATVLKTQMEKLAAQEYDCDSNICPVVKIAHYGCSLFPRGNEYPFPAFHEMFTQAVEYYSLLHEAGVPLSQAMVYLDMEFQMAGKHEHIQPNKEKVLLLFVDQDKSFLQQITEAPYLEPHYREMLAAYLTMHLGVDKHFQEEIKAIPAKMEEYYQKRTEQVVSQHFGATHPPAAIPRFYDEAVSSAHEAFREIAYLKDYKGRLPSETIPKGDIQAIAFRLYRIVDTLDPCGDESYERFTPAEVVKAISNGDYTRVNGYIEKLQSIEGIYEGAAFNLAVAIEEVFPEQDIEQPEENITPEQVIKPSILEGLQKYKPEAAGTEPPKTDKAKDKQR